MAGLLIGDFDNKARYYQAKIKPYLVNIHPCDDTLAESLKSHSRLVHTAQHVEDALKTSKYDVVLLHADFIKIKNINLSYVLKLPNSADVTVIILYDGVNKPAVSAYTASQRIVFVPDDALLKIVIAANTRLRISGEKPPAADFDNDGTGVRTPTGPNTRPGGASASFPLTLATAAAGLTL